MREILFRGKRKDNGEWIEGQLLHFKASVGTNEFTSIIQSCEWDNENEWFNLGKRARVDIETVGQYTGLTDKNGKKIFEGDIIIESDGGMGGIPREVLWDEVWMQFECRLVRKHWAYGRNSGRLWLMRDKDIEIIGNIHDNPELLGGGSDA